MSGRIETAALFLLSVLSVVWAWWAWQDGAYFAVVMLPGGLVLLGTLCLLCGFAPWRASLRLSPPALVALVALLALAVWTGVSATWSPAPDIAVVDGQRVLLYALAFGLGLWLCNLVGSRMELTLLPLAVAAGFAGVATVVALIGDDPRSLLSEDNTLDFPLGYRNANAAFFAIGLFASVGLASKRGLDFRARGLALGVATLSVCLFLLSQSRASAPALGVSVIVLVLLSPQRLRAASWLALAAIPALAILPSLTDFYAAANDGTLAEAIDSMHSVARAAAFIAAGAAVLGAIAARNENALPGLGSRSDRANAVVARVMLGAGIAALLAFVVAVGNPVDWVGERAEEFKSSGSPDLAQSSSRFTLNAGSDRYDLWRVAIDDFTADPLFGDGAGGFEYTYAQNRDVAYQNARDAHSVEFELLAELGLPGLLLWAAAIVAALLGILRARRLGPSAAALGAVALAVGSYWFVHASLDWFWPYAGLTAPVIMLAGAACAPAIYDPGAGRRRGRRGLLIAISLLAGATMLPPFLSERYVNDAFDGWQSDLGRAYSDLDAARTLNPLSEVPLLAEIVIAREAGDEERAIEAAREAVAKRPEEYAAHYLLAELEAKRDRLLARNEARVALELNPLDEEVQALARRLGVPVPAP